MPDKEQILRDAYRYVGDWTDENKAKFAQLLTDDVVWIEGDTDIGVETYRSKQEVLRHLEDVQSRLVLAQVKKVDIQGDHGTTRDDMQMQGHPQHGCITDVVFRGDLIAHVHHCMRRE